MLSPKISLREPFRWGAHDDDDSSEGTFRKLVDWDLVLTEDHVHSTLGDRQSEHWRNALPLLLNDFQQLLTDALDIQRELGEAGGRDDRSYWHLPSISAHRQNRGFRDWTALIELLRDSWLEVRNHEPGRASQIAQAWFELPYPTFKRLALFGASQPGSVSSELWVSWLLTDMAWWLWSVQTRRETMRLLVTQGSHLKPDAQAKLESTILTGPPREMYRDDLEDERWEEIIADSVWLRLAKLKSSGITLGAAASERLASLSQANPGWQLDPKERDEFSHWMTGTGDPDYEDHRHIDVAPRNRHDLAAWLRRLPARDERVDQDTWRETCRARFFHSLFALCELSQEGNWPSTRWRDALQAWSEDGLAARSWRFAAPLVQRMPNQVLQELGHPVGWWLDATSKLTDLHRAILLDLCHRLLNLPFESASGIQENGVPNDRPVTEAINHPIGLVTQALLNHWFKREPNDNDRLPSDIEPYFRQLCDRKVPQLRHGRVLLASRLIALFRVDPAWTEAHLLPLMSWTANPMEAKALWEGFLWSPRLHRPLLTVFKSQFLETAHHYAELGEHRGQFATFLTYAALQPAESYTTQDYQSAIAALPQEGLEEVAQALSQALEGAGAQREDYWRNRVLPFWNDIWPKSRTLVSKTIAESLARMAVAAGGEFPSAVSSVRDWLLPVEHPHYAVHLLRESGLCPRFPDAALQLLHALIDAQPWLPSELSQCLQDIAQAKPSLSKDARYVRLSEHLRRQGV